MPPWGVACLCLLWAWGGDGSAVIGSLTTLHRTAGVRVYGNTAYVACGDSGLIVVDVTDPANLVILGSYDTPGYSNDVTVDTTAGIAYVADNTEGIQILDVSTPASISRIAHYDISRARGVVHHEGLLYVADFGWGMRIFNVSAPASPTLLGSLPTPGSLYGVYVDHPSQTAYLACEKAGLVIADVSSPTSPKERGRWDDKRTALRLVVSGSSAYLADNSGGLVILDVADPKAITVLSDNEVKFTNTTDVLVHNGIAYIAEGSSVRVLDVSSLPPTLLDTIAPLPGVAHLDVVGDVVYAACSPATLYAIRIDSLPPPAPPPPTLPAPVNPSTIRIDTPTPTKTIPDNTPRDTSAEHSTTSVEACYKGDVADPDALRGRLANILHLRPEDLAEFKTEATETCTTVKMRIPEDKKAEYEKCAHDSLGDSTRLCVELREVGLLATPKMGKTDTSALPIPWWGVVLIGCGALFLVLGAIYCYCMHRPQRDNRVNLAEQIEELKKSEEYWKMTRSKREEAFGRKL